VIEITTVFSARLYGSRSHKTKRPLNELTENSENGEKSVITKSMRPEDVSDEAVRDLLTAMQEAQISRDLTLH
jgi:hypothetical protein